MVGHMLGHMLGCILGLGIGKISWLGITFSQSWNVFPIGKMLDHMLGHVLGHVFDHMLNHIFGSSLGLRNGKISWPGITFSRFWNEFPFIHSCLIHLNFLV